MKECRCIDKQRDKNGKIIAYKLVDKQGTTAVMKADVLKNAIKSKEIFVRNLVLTSDGRLLTSNSKEKELEEEEVISNYLIRVNLIIKNAVKQVFNEVAKQKHFYYKVLDGDRDNKGKVINSEILIVEQSGLKYKDRDGTIYFQVFASNAKQWQKGNSELHISIDLTDENLDIIEPKAFVELRIKYDLTCEYSKAAIKKAIRGMLNMLNKYNIE